MCSRVSVFDELFEIRKNSGRIAGMAEADRDLLGSAYDDGCDCDISGKDHSKEHVHRLRTGKRQKNAGALPALERRYPYG